jgi:hypothetical protein
LVPITVTVNVEARATGAVAAVVAEVAADAAVLDAIADTPLMLTIPAIVVPSTFDGLEGPPPHDATANPSISRYDPEIRVLFAPNTIAS